METLTLKQQEKIFKNILLNHFEKQGYIYFHEYQNSYFRKFENDTTLEDFVIGGKTGSKIHNFVHRFAFLDIEDLIFEIGLPNIELNSYDRKKDFLFTVCNNHINLTYNTEERPVQTEQDCIDYCQSIIAYMETDGKAFVEKYSYLPNILEEIEENTKNGINWSYGVFSGITAPFFKGLIISKLCNDPKIEEKIKYVDWVYYPPEHKLQEFIPFYEKLKKRLKSVDPIYHV